MFRHLRHLLADRLHRGERGASAVEYGLLVAGIALVVMVTTFAFGTVLEGSFNTTCANVSDGVTGGTC